MPLISSVLIKRELLNYSFLAVPRSLFPVPFFGQKPFSETLDFVENQKSFTYRYAQSITEQVIHSDVNNVAKTNGLTDEEVWSMVMAVAQ